MATKKTPVLSQYDILFSAPLWADMQVETIDDLQNVKYLYPSKLVWVKSESMWYYYQTSKTTLVNGVEVIQLIWEKQSSRSEITVYSPADDYKKGESVFIDGKIYTALMDINKLETPLVSYIPAKWLCVAGNTLTRTNIFSNMSVVTITTDISNPIFSVYMKNLDNSYEQIYPSFEKISDTEYRFEFYTNGELTSISGYIIHK